MYCDRDICLLNDYNGIGCEECIVNKNEEDSKKMSMKHKMTEEDLDHLQVIKDFDFDSADRDEYRDFLRVRDALCRIPCHDGDAPAGKSLRRAEMPDLQA